MKTLLLLIYFTALSSLLYADWNPQSSGTTNWLNSIYFVNENYGWAVGNHGTIVHTTNGGEIWLPQTSGLTSFLRAVFFLDQNTGWAVGGEHIINTIDGGAMWNSQNHGTTGYFRSIHFVDENIGYACGNDGLIIKTTNGGQNWIQQNSAITKHLYSIYFYDENLGWATGELLWLLKTTNGGDFWWVKNYGTAGDERCIYFRDANNGIVVGGYDMVHQGDIGWSTDGGEFWTEANHPQTDELRSVTFSNSTTGWIAGYSGQILKSTNGGFDWDFDNSGITTHLSSITFPTENKGWVCGENGVILTYGNPASVWHQTNFPLNETINSIVNIDGYFLAGTESGLVYRSSDLGENWITVVNGISGSSVRKLFGYQNGNNSTVYAATDDGVFKTSDYGDLWEEISASFSDKNVWEIYRTENYLFAGASSKTYRSTNEGNSWDEIILGSVNQTARTFLRSGNNVLAGLIGTGNYIYISSDFGLTWIPSDNGITSSDVTALEKLSNRNFAASNAILYQSTDEGATWEAPDFGLPANMPISYLKSFENYMFIASLGGIHLLHSDSSSVTNIDAGMFSSGILAADVAEDFIVLGTVSEGIWIRPAGSVIVSVEKEPAIVESFTLFQNYPNPFNPTTVIRYTIPKSNFASLKVYDVLGNEIATLVNEELSAGEYEVEFSSNLINQVLTSGIYFYQLRAGEFIQTKKMLLIK